MVRWGIMLAPMLSHCCHVGTTSKHISSASEVKAVTVDESNHGSGSNLFAGFVAYMPLSRLCKLTSLVACERPTQRLQAMLPAFRGLRRLKCIVNSFHTDGSGALPVLSELTALEELHMEGQLMGDYKLAFPPSLKVPTTVGLLHAISCCTAPVPNMYASSCSCQSWMLVMHASGSRSNIVWFAVYTMLCTRRVLP